MAPRAPGVHTHEEWKGMAQPVGLVVEPVVLNRLGVFPESATTVLADWQQRVEQLLEDQPVVDQAASEQWLSVAPSFELFCQEVLAWQPGDLRKPEELAAEVAVTLDDYDEVLRPDWIIPEPSQGDGPLKAQMLVQELPLGTPFDALPKGADGRRSWEATPQQRLERLLKESEHPIGVLWNGVALRLVYAPRGESSGHLTFPLEPMTTVDGRPMLAALQMLLGPDRLFEGGASNTRLRPLMEQSRKEQNEVSTRLAEQVLEALWILLRGFDAAGLELDDPSHIYGGLITVLLRLVFLLYAEDEELMPTDSLYGQHYSVGGLAQRLRQDRADYQNAMEGRRGAWATLLSLFRLVYDGGGSSEAYLPARHGDLFDPEIYPFLEGRTADTTYTDGPLTSVPAISDDVVEQVLTKLLLLDGQILSYRALDVEQIGSVYEGIMGFMVEKATGPSVGITYRPLRQKITITVVVDAEQLLAVSPAKREKWLDDQAGVPLKLPAKAKQGFKEAASLEELCLALGNQLSSHTPRGLAAGSLILQPTAERRRSGSHYTPRALTEPIVAEAFRPWLERCNGQPTAEEILALKVCDPAMGSGAFLVAVCRYLAGWLVQAWEREGYPEGFRQEWDKDTVARRLIAQSCLYGVDKNPFAVNLAKLSLWLVTLSKELPFTFVDHALKCGDSLVGYSVQEIRAAMREVQLGFLDDQNRIYEQMGIDRRESFSFDSLTDADYDTKKLRLEQQIKATEGLRQAGDLMVAAFFAKTKPKEREEKKQVYLAMLSGTFHDDALAESVQEIRGRLAAGDKGVSAFHWDLEFPEVFRVDRYGFDAIVGNPPFAGSTTLSRATCPGYTDWLRNSTQGAGGKCDLSVFFLRSAFKILCRDGTLGIITTASISEGENRISGLGWLQTNADMVIYAAKKSFWWPGVANVKACHFHIQNISGDDRRLACTSDQFNQFLVKGTSREEPFVLRESTSIAFLGCKPGVKYHISPAETANVHFPGYDKLKAEVRDNYFRSYVGGTEILQSPDCIGGRIACNIGLLDRLDCDGDQKVVDMLDIASGLSPADGDSRFKFARRALDLQARKKQVSEVIVRAEVSDTWAYTKIWSGHIFSNKAVVFCHGRPNALLAVLSSRLHEVWGETLGSKQGDGLSYSPRYCMENFPMPSELLTVQAMTHISHESTDTICTTGLALHKFRSGLLLKNNEGLTSTYNRFHDPAETSEGLLQLRALHQEMDQSVLNAYGWSDVLTACGFGLDYLDTEEDAQLPDELQERIDSGELFFWDAGDALDFQGQLQAYGAITGRRKLPWRYRWPDAVRDDVLARLLALNAERYEEEVAMGLHSKGGKAAAKASKAVGSAAGGKGRGRPPKTPPPDSGQTVQIGLVL